MYYPVQIKLSYDFVFNAPAILGSGYKQATVMGVMDFDSAKLVQDVVPLHAAAYPSLSAGVPRDAKDLTYIKVKTTTGEIRVFAMDWLAAAPELVTSQTIQLTIADVSLGDISVIKDILIQNGFPNVTAVVVV